MPRIYKPRNPNNTDVRLCPLQSVRQSFMGRCPVLKNPKSEIQFDNYNNFLYIGFS